MSQAFAAMQFARDVHKHQIRKYTGNPYTDHLAEVAGITAATLADSCSLKLMDTAVAVAWLHDSVEDQEVSPAKLASLFGNQVAEGVVLLSDLEAGNRAQRKAASCERLATAPGWVQTIKCADLVSNTQSIVKHDPKFAVTYLEEKRALLKVLTKADPRVLGLAYAYVL